MSKFAHQRQKASIYGETTVRQRQGNRQKTPKNQAKNPAKTSQISAKIPNNGIILYMPIFMTECLGREGGKSGSIQGQRQGKSKAKVSSKAGRILDALKGV